MAAILPIAPDNGPHGRPTKSSGTGGTRESSTAGLLPADGPRAGPRSPSGCPSTRTVRACGLPWGGGSREPGAGIREPGGGRGPALAGDAGRPGGPRRRVGCEGRLRHMQARLPAARRAAGMQSKDGGAGPAVLGEATGPAPAPVAPALTLNGPSSS